MTMPGFSAETSTYKSTDLYRRYGVAASIMGAPKVNPAQTDSQTDCLVGCDLAYDVCPSEYGRCLLKCIHNGGGNGGGGGGCRLVQGPGSSSIIVCDGEQGGQ
jgi:hypothetical protein